ncbi:MAG: type II toxin-antitoxin system RelE/ParE family toxin [Candidatus Harrisonbacteria bacterium]|nr:type II toxin-antitoxin system RelE/ParE family toxin [Candidatus Harrisonbacteria bacterium]
MYLLHFGNSFLDSVKKLDHTIQLQVKKKLERLESGTVKIESLREDLVGKYKVRVGKFRIIFKFLNEREILLLEVGPRDKIYK